MQTFVKFVSKIDLKKVQNAKPRLELEIFFFLFFSLKLIPTLNYQVRPQRMQISF